MSEKDPGVGQQGERRDLLIFLLVLVMGFVCLLITAQMAVLPRREWQASAGMLSELDPNGGYGTAQPPIEPLLPDIMTPPSWNINDILTPRGGATVIPPVILSSPQPSGPTAAPTEQVPSTQQAGSPTPTGPVSRTPSPSPTPVTPTPTPSPTPTRTPTVTPTNTPTATSTPTNTPTATNTPSTTPEPTLPPHPPPPPPRPTDAPPPTRPPL